MGDIRDGVRPEQVALAFHLGVAAGVAEVCRRLSARHDVKRAALSGGVFQNDLLLRLLTERLTESGVEVIKHQRVPPNDAGIAFGQAAVALARQEKGAKVRAATRIG